MIVGTHVDGNGSWKKREVGNFLFGNDDYDIQDNFVRKKMKN